MHILFPARINCPQYDYSIDHYLELNQITFKLIKFADAFIAHKPVLQLPLLLLDFHFGAT